MANIFLEGSYRCSDDCRQSGCPGHTATLKYQSCADAYTFNLNGKEMFFERGELEAMVSLLRDLNRSDSVKVDTGRVYEFNGDEVPSFRDATGPQHELESVVDAERCRSLVNMIVGLRQQLADAKSALGGFCMAPLDGTVATGIKALSMRCAAAEEGLRVANNQWPTADDCLGLAEMLSNVPGGIGEAIDAFRAIAAQKELSVKY